jgi:hypothetical protein
LNPTKISESRENNTPLDRRIRFFPIDFSEEKDLGISMENENSLGKQTIICAEESKIANSLREVG